MPRVDIIIRSKGGRDMLHELILSIARNTPDDLYRLIVVDDGSEDQLIRDTGPVIDFYLRSSQSHGAVSATNLGLSVSLRQNDSPYTLILDNDTKIPDGDSTWLQRMIGELEAGGEKTACVGATSDFVNVPQMVLAAPEVYVGGDNPPVPWFVSFCVLFRKSVLSEIGLWDERYNPGNYEDTDYAVSVRAAGYEIRVARSVYVYHRGHTTFGDECAELIQKNRVKFHAKWGPGRLWDMGFLHPVHLAPLFQESLKEMGAEGISA